MKNLIAKSLLMLGMVAALATSCKNKDSEKKIAELESRLAEIQAKKEADPTATTPAASTEVKPEGPLAVFEFETMDHDFGTIKEGDVVEYTYKFKNTGDAPLIIQDAAGSCGCTVPNWPKDPIPAGGSGEITAKFNSAGKKELQNKTVTVTANTFPKRTVLKFKAMVTPKPSDDNGPLKK
jgi:hypothetical protein